MSKTKALGETEYEWTPPEAYFSFCEEGIEGLEPDDAIEDLRQEAQMLHGMKEQAIEAHVQLEELSSMHQLPDDIRMDIGQMAQMTDDLYEWASRTLNLVNDEIRRLEDEN